MTSWKFRSIENPGCENTCCKKPQDHWSFSLWSASTTCLTHYSSEVNVHHWNIYV